MRKPINKMSNNDKTKIAYKPIYIFWIERMLRFMARMVLYKYHPKIVGITGSLGKTSTREAVFMALSSKYRTRRSCKNYNNEIGVPLTIIGVSSGGASIVKWIRIVLKWLKMILIREKNYPEILVLEMGVDRPGDMDYLMEFIPVDVGVVTNVSSSHLEYFSSLDHIAREKGKLIKKLLPTATAIINADDERVSRLARKTKARIFSFGIKREAKMTATDIIFNYSENNFPSGISFKLNFQGKILPVRLRHTLAWHQVYSALIALAVGEVFKINLVQVAIVLEKLSPLPGRLNLIAGQKKSLIIDDTYNASPESTLVALDVLKKISASRKIAVLGDMLELGKDSQNGHERVMSKLLEINPSLIIGVGERITQAFNFLRQKGYAKEKIFIFNDPVSAGNFLKKQICSGDLILIKGSQSMRMEKAVVSLMAFPEEASAKLCRQTEDWLKIPFNKP